MDAQVVLLADEYRRSRRPGDGDPVEHVRRLYAEYSLRGEVALLDAIGASAAVYGLLSRSDEFTPEMREAFGLAYPSVNLDSLVGRTPEELAGYMNGWRGKYFEVLVRDRLNAGDAVGDLHLSDGQIAVLADSPVQPGWDLAILNADGSVADQIQLKATNSLAYVKEALERYPDIEVVSTDEVAALSDDILSSGIANGEISEDLLAPMADLAGTTIGEVATDLMPLLPVVVLALTEGRHVIAGRKSLHDALSDGTERAIKTGAAMGVGGIVSLLDGGLLSIPAAMFTRLGIDRYLVAGRAIRQLEPETRTLADLCIRGPAYDG